MDMSTNAPISKYTPLLSNLNSIENISLIKEVHEHLSTPQAQQLATDALAKAGYGHLALLRNAQCSMVERFVVKLIRATMLQYDKIVISMPFNLIEDSKNIDFFLDLFRLLDITDKVMILDITTNRKNYTEVPEQCHITE